MKILFVENHAVFADQVCRQFLTSHEVKIVLSLQRAREELASQNYDLLLVDYDLDDGKGDQLIREVSSTNPDTKIIAVSSHEEGNAALTKAGAWAVCNKMNFDRISDVIASLESC